MKAKYDKQLERDAAIAAAAQFDPDQYEPIENVCYFAEHEVEHNGKKVRIGPEDLAAIADRCNYRIADTGNFAPITAGHTPSQEDRIKGAEEPEILGFAGPMRLGTLGEKDPKVAIFCTEYAKKDSVDKLKSRPRRSPELWLLPDKEKRFIDPVAALGSETPKLALGMTFRREAGIDGPLVKYQATPVFAGGSNTYVPDDENENYQENDEMADIAHAVEAFESLEWVAELKSLLPALREQVAGQAEAEEAAADAENFQEEDEEKKEEYMEGNDEEKKEEYMEGEDHDKEKGMDYKQEAHAAQLKYKMLEGEHKKLKTTVDRMVRDKTDEARAARLEQLSGQYAMDLEKEAKRCLYSMGSKMGDEQFKEHVSLIEDNYSKLPIGTDTLDVVARYAEQDGGKNAKQDKEFADRVVKYHQEQLAAGKNLSWNDAVAAVSSNGSE